MPETTDSARITNEVTELGSALILKDFHDNLQRLGLDKIGKAQRQTMYIMYLSGVSLAATMAIEHASSLGNVMVAEGERIAEEMRNEQKEE